MIAIVYNTTEKTFSLVSTELARAMLFMGNPHGFNRAVTGPESGRNQMVSVMIENGFKKI